MCDSLGATLRACCATGGFPNRPTVSPYLSEFLPARRPAVVWTRLPDGAVLFCPETEVYYGLNDVGALIWELLSEESLTLEALCDRVLRAFPDAGRDQVREDVDELLDELERSGLLVTDERDLEP